jgi:hypothetical protein
LADFLSDGVYIRFSSLERDIDQLAATMADVLAADDGDDETADPQSLPVPAAKPSDLQRKRGVSGDGGFDGCEMLGGNGLGMRISPESLLHLRTLCARAEAHSPSPAGRATRIL